MHIAALQMVSSPDVADNLRRARALIDRAAQAGAELVALPEYFCIMGQRDTDKLAHQEHFDDGPIQAALRDAARDNGVWLVGGTLPLSTGDAIDAQHVFNSSLAFNQQGECVARYDKVHLFRLDNGQEQFDESRVLRAGHEAVGFDVQSRDGHRWRVGLSICYDLRFPELYRQHADAGAHLLLAPSAFTYTTGQAHWDLLTRCRAVENQAVMLAPAQGGVHDNGRRTWGHSRVVNAWGEVLAECVEGEGVALAEVRMSDVQAVRQRIPALHHRVL